MDGAWKRFGYAMVLLIPFGALWGAIFKDEAQGGFIFFLFLYVLFGPFFSEMFSNIAHAIASLGRGTGNILFVLPSRAFVAIISFVFRILCRVLMFPVNVVGSIASGGWRVATHPARVAQRAAERRRQEADAKRDQQQRQQLAETQANEVRRKADMEARRQEAQFQTDLRRKVETNRRMAEIELEKYERISEIQARYDREKVELEETSDRRSKQRLEEMMAKSREELAKLMASI